MTKVLEYSLDSRDSVLETAVAVLGEERAVIFPSDTVYALLASANSSKGYGEIFTLKMRDPSQKLAMLAAPSHPVVTEVMKLLNDFEDEQDAFLAGLLTAVFPAGRLRRLGSQVSQIQPGSLGIRVPAWEPLSELIDMCGGLLWGTSANISGQDPQTTAEDMLAALPAFKQSVALCVTVPMELQGVVSDVVMFGPDGPVVIR
jgi:L-threonylcarbamoyladenylate synthase